MSCLCQVCGVCEMRREQGRRGDAGGQLMAGRDQQERAVTPSDAAERASRPVHAAEATLVWVLEEKTDPTRRQVSCYSGLNGLHIRTIPGTRWSNPVAIAAWGNYLAVVDRYGDRDLIRVTDRYAGAGEAGFRDSGFADPDVDWPSVPDLFLVTLPGDLRVQGLAVLPGSGLCVATVQRTGAADTPLWYLVDLKGRIEDGRIDAAYNGLIEIGAPYADAGRAVGNVAAVSDRGTARGDEYRFYGLLSHSERGPAVCVVDFVRSRIDGLQGLPADRDPIAVTAASGIVSVFTADTGEDAVSQILRFRHVRDGGVFTQIGQVTVPEMASYSVTHTFAAQDLARGGGTSRDAVVDYQRIAATLNRGYAELTDTLSEIDDAYGDLPAEVTRTVETASQSALNDDRSPAETTVTSAYQGIPLTVGAQKIETETANRLIGAAGAASTIAEAYQREADGAMDPEQILFRLLHGTHFDWLSDGGFTYGCQRQTGENSVLTNGARPLSIAVTSGLAVGTLKEIPDFKVALIDDLTNRFIYRYPKPLGVKVYGGYYAGLKLPTENSPIKTTPCTTEQETIATAIDGTTRPGRERANSRFDLDDDLDFPWSLFKRRVLKGAKKGVAQFEQRSWSTRAEDGAFKTEWLGDFPTPFTVTPSASQLFWPGPRGQEEYITSVNGGYFFLGPPKIASTRGVEIEADIADAQDRLAQAERDRAGATGTEADALDARITGIEAEIASLNASLGALSADERNQITYVTPRSLRNERFGGLDVSAGQELDPLTLAGEVEDIDPPTGDVIPGSPGEEDAAQSGETVDLVRAIRIRPNIRSWIGLTIFCSRYVQVDGGGVDGYTNPVARQNGYGFPVGSYATGQPTEGFRLYGSSVYESGYRAREGALGVWEVDISFNGQKPNRIANRVTFLDQLVDLAPSDAAGPLGSVLYYGFGGGLPGEFFMKGYVYWSEEEITRITVTVRLVNIAYHVYRIGYRGISRESTGSINALGYYCTGADPGYYVDSTCESLGCGNVTCASAILFGQKLYASDPVQRRTRQVLWETTTRFGVSANNPYRDRNIATGNVIFGDVTMRLNAPMNAYRVDISTNS